MIFEGIEIPDNIYKEFNDALERIIIICDEAAEALKNMFRNIFTK